MKPTSQIVHTFAALLITCSLVSTVQAASIGLNFVRGAGADGPNVQNGFANALLPTDTAGVPGMEQANWNNLGSRGTNITLIDSAGASSGVVVNWVAANCWSQSGGGTPNVQGSPDANLMNSYLDSNNGANTTFATNLWLNPTANMPLVHITGLSTWLATQGATYYDVAIYYDGDVNNNSRVGEYWTVDANADPTNLTLGSDQVSHVFICDRVNFVNTLTYSQVPLIVRSGNSAKYGNFPANYAVFESLTADTFVLRTAEFDTRATINALQIIPRTTAVPATIAPLPSPKVVAGSTVRIAAQVGGRMPQTYQWQKAGGNLSDGGNIAGSTTTTLTISNASALDAAAYTLAVTSPVGSITSSPANLSIYTPTAGSFAQGVVAGAPYAYWRFNDLEDPASNFATAADAAGYFNGTYGNLAQNGYHFITGPTPSQFPGFESDNMAYQSANTVMRTWVTAPPLNLNTNTVTLCAWIYPYAAQANATALLATRNGNDVAAFGFSSYYGSLGYTWNSNSAATYNFTVGSAGYATPLIPPTNSWSFVALTISPSNAVLYLFNTNGQFTATNAITHTNQALSGPTFLGNDPQNSANTPQGRSFNGIIDELAVFNRTLPADELWALYKKGVGVSLPTIAQQPQPLTVMEGRPVKFSILASGEGALSYQWRKNNGNLSDAGTISGALSPTLNISAVSMADDADYDVVVTGAAGSTTSVKAHLTIVATNAAPSAYEAAVQKANPIAFWRMNEMNGTTASDYWGGNIAQHNPSVALGVDGPQSPGFLGLETTNRAAQYDGFAGGTSSSSSLLNNRSQFSVIGWFNTPAQLQQNRAGLFGQNDVCEFGFHGTATLAAQQVGVWTPRAAAYLSVTNLIPDQWYLIAAVGSGSSINLYLVSTNNGVTILQASTSHAATTSYGQSIYPFRIGGDGILDASANYFTGLIDEVAVFDRALTADELAGLLATALTGTELAPPTISIQPTPTTTLYAGRTAQLSVTAVGLGLKYQWRKNGLPISDAGNVSGTKTNTLTLTSLIAGNAGDYDVVITNNVGSITSSNASLFVITPTPGGYEAAVIAANPLVYYRLGELDDPASGTVTAFDYLGGRNGTYGAAAQNGFNSIAGPLAPDWNFETTNSALRSVGLTATSWVTTPALGVTTNTVTITAWLYPISYADLRTGIVFARAGQAATGLNFINGTNLNYHWLDTAATYNWDSGLNVPTNQWSFIALAVEPTRATMYLLNTNVVQSNTNVAPHDPRAFTDTIRIGGDPNNDVRTFDGVIDEVAIFNRTLTKAEIESMYVAAGGTLPATPITLHIQKVGDMVVLEWSSGTLLQADEATGPWTTNNAASPFTNAPSAAKKFYRVIVK